jgi:hypothetical protein
MDLWHAYEAEWEETPFVDDLAANYLGYRKAKGATPVPTSLAEYAAKYGPGKPPAAGPPKPPPLVTAEGQPWRRM